MVIKLKLTLTVVVVFFSQPNYRSFGSNESWSTVMGSTPFMSGVSTFKIRIEKSQTAYLFIGVCTKNAGERAKEASKRLRKRNPYICIAL